jgi:short-subunit dehydrogenase
MPNPAALRLAVITGASAGIGLALARAIAREGRPVLAVARRGERLQGLAAEASSRGWAPVHPLAVDLAAPSAAGEVLARAEELGGAEWLVNNAGFGLYGPVAEADPAHLAQMIRVNCESVVLLTRLFLPSLGARGGGFILNVASIVAFQPSPFLSVYAATKAFVLSFTEGLSEELRGSGVGAGAFCPGPVTTEFQALAGSARRAVRGPAILTAEQAAREVLAQLRGREVVRVPRLAYRVLAASAGLLPRGVVRRLSGRLNRPSRPGRESRPDGSAR